MALLNFSFIAYIKPVFEIVYKVISIFHPLKFKEILTTPIDSKVELTNKSDTDIEIDAILFPNNKISNIVGRLDIGKPKFSECKAYFDDIERKNYTIHPGNKMIIIMNYCFVKGDKVIFVSSNGKKYTFYLNGPEKDSVNFTK
ncbi:hypothetical protein FXE12_12320 [Lactobacillus sp. SL9-6]|nr:hypothetical protein FXE12_12320 [Lactobacillus sp. SL9-6]